ncbi:hypothetical protein Q9Q94_04810 [Uliginosibacterium sp. 31-16]|uniref:hypothetical protein n=1 Tax=Uliginosibacterium sp. 31-16 TaxID=3068315 RepID=UPI00273E0DA2|nr:hypothetical protein [Uliginosibacterium sp. 31-16]MDP5238836.1 hypothetical protein [Uliginosibacterium sp. 31-16]
MTLLWIAVFFLLTGLIANLLMRRELRSLRRQGIYPPPDQASDADVRNLLEAGYPVFAMRCFRDIHGGSLKDAKTAINRLKATNPAP